MSITTQIDDPTAAALQRLVDRRNKNTNANLTIESLLNTRFAEVVKNMASMAPEPAPAPAK